MCGIAGFVAFKPTPAGTIQRMAEAVRHRGPDDEGYAIFAGATAVPSIYGGLDTPPEVYAADLQYAPRERIESATERADVALGFRRLAIIDTSPGGHQPMSGAEGHAWIVYNGEIYNHVELRCELQKLNHSFVSHSDTEVILAAYKQWGRECLPRLNGMFAFLLYDPQRRTFFAARDRFGIKPLYYRVSDDGIAFASEIKQFTTLSDWKPKLNRQRAYDFLNWGITDHTDETLFQGVFQIRGGEALELDLGALNANKRFAAGERLPVRRWYRLEPKPFVGTQEEAAADFREKLLDSVRLHLRADVPVGSCLSGGLDSSSIVCVANQLLREQSADHLQKTYSACAHIERYDERKWIDLVVSATGVDANFVYPELGNLFEDAPRITWHQDEPFGSTSMYAQWKVFELAAKGPVKVMLDGQGSDEYIGGYHSFFSAHLGALFRSGRLLALAREAGALHRVHGFGFGRVFAHLADGILPESVKDLARRATGRTTANPAWLDMSRLGSVAVNPFQTAGASAPRSIRDLSVAQLTASNLQMLLHWEDRDSMAHSIESRVPFLDYRLVEFVLGLPDDFKVSDGLTKRVLREGMTGIIPQPIRNRTDKLGFVTPEQAWLREADPELFRRKLDESVAASQGILRGSEARKLLDEVIDGRRPFSFLPWRMINFGMWMKEFSVSLDD